MKILIIGANGRLGRCLVDQALDQGYTVTAAVRSRASLTLTHPLLTIAEADLTRPASLDEVVGGHDAVLVAVAPKLRLWHKSEMMSVSATNLCLAMKKASVSRLLWVTSAGLDKGYVRAKPAIYKYLIRPFFLASVYADFSKSEEVVKAAALEWVIVRPSRLTDGALTKDYRLSASGSPPKATTISRADVADFMLRETGKPAHTLESVIIAY